jgi:hypothetical protein
VLFPCGHQLVDSFFTLQTLADNRLQYTENRWLTQTLTYSLQTPPRIAMPTVLVVGAAGGLGHRTALVLAAMPGAVTVRGLVRSLAPSNAGKQQVTCIHCTVLLRIFFCVSSFAIGPYVSL